MTETALKNFIADSVLPYPRSAVDRIKYFFWRTINPFHVSVRDRLLALRIIHHTILQGHLLGTIAPGKTVAALLKHLESLGFGNHFIAWIDEGELAGLRKLDGFEWQYHLRIFKDGFVRGHYEHTPESHPVRHFKEWGMEVRREEFLAFLEGWIVPSSG